MENLTKLNDDTYKYAIEMINKKDFDDYTTKRVWDYIESHDILYGDIIDTKDVIDRIGENLSKNIVIEQKYSSIIEKGGFSPVHREIVVHTKDFGDDEYFHELDHVATSNLSTMPDYDAEDAWDMEKMNERYNNGYEFFLGIERLGQEPAGPDYRIGTNENEGITVIKQEAYAKMKKMNLSSNGYGLNYKIAKQMAYFIGEDNLIQKQFYNDIAGIESSLEQYGIDYNLLLKLSSQFINNDTRSIDFYQNMVDPEARKSAQELSKQKYQDIMARGFVEKRCKELGIKDVDLYYKKLNRKQKKTELLALKEFEEFKLCDSTVLEGIRESLQPQSFLQKIKNFFQKKNTVMLPAADNENRTEEGEKFKAERNSWDLSNWDISVEDVREKTEHKAQEYLMNSDVQTQNSSRTVESAGNYTLE